MKKKYLLLFFLFLLLGFVVLYFNESIRFKISYEYINYVEYNNGKRIEISIPFDNRIKYINEEQLLNFLDNGTGIVYFGYNTCPWCRNAIPILIDTVKKNNIDTIYYADINKLNIKSIKQELYYILDDYLEENNDGKKVLAVPDVYFIKNGVIIGQHRGTVDSYHNPYIKMNSSQKKELTKIYQKYIEEMK